MPSGRTRFVPTESDKQLADKILKARLAGGLTQEVFAKAIGVSTRTVRRIEAAKAPVSLTLFRRMNEILDFAAGIAAGSMAKSKGSPLASELARYVPPFVPAPPLHLQLSVDEWMLVRSYRDLAPQRRVLLLEDIMRATGRPIDVGPKDVAPLSDALMRDLDSATRSYLDMGETEMGADAVTRLEMLITEIEHQLAPPPEFADRTPIPTPERIRELREALLHWQTQLQEIRRARSERERVVAPPTDPRKRPRPRKAGRLT